MLIFIMIIVLFFVEVIYKVKMCLCGVVEFMLLMYNYYMLEYYGCCLYFKWEDMQVVCFYKIWGVYNKMVMVFRDKLVNGVVCVSVGNYVQGFVLACQKM